MPSELQTVTIFRTWVELASTLKGDAERGRLYHAICLYSLCGIEPDLESDLKPFFNIMRPSIDKSNKKKIAQQKSMQNRLHNAPQNDLQNDLHNAPQNDLQNDLHNAPQKGFSRASKTGTETEKKGVTKVTPKEKVSFSIMLPDHLQCSDVDQKWKEWEAYRRKKGKPISELAARQQMKMLQDLSREEAIAAIDNSIANDYQGLFPPKKAGQKIFTHPKKDYSQI